MRPERAFASVWESEVFADPDMTFLGNWQEDKYCAVRGAAAAALGKIGPAAIPALKEALKDSDWKVGARLPPWPLGTLVQQPSRSSQDCLKEKDQTLRQIGARKRWGELAGSHAGPYGTAQGQRQVDWDTAISALGEIGPEAIPTIMGLLSDKDGMIQQAAAITLGNMGPKAKVAIPALTKLLKDRIQRSAVCRSDPGSASAPRRAAPCQP